MINYELPKIVEINEKEYPINKDGDYRMVLDVICALNDEKMSLQERATVALNIFYNFNVPKETQEAYDKMCLFIDCKSNDYGGKDEQSQDKPVMDWEFDFSLIVSAINKVLGYDVRSKEYIHWWTFYSAFMEIDEKSLFSQIISLRIKKQKGKKLDDAEKEFYKTNKKLIDLPIKYTQEEEEFFKKLLSGEVE